MHVLRHPRLAGASPTKLIASGATLAIGLVALEAIAAPARADAFLGLPDPAEIVKDGVKTSFDFVLKQLFGGIPTKITEAAVSWQLHLPSEAFHNSNVTELNRTTTAAAFALLSLVMTASVLRFWLTGLFDGSGGADGATGFVRGIAAALGVVAWPWAFNSSIALVNSLTYELIHANSVHDDISRMLGAAVGIQLQGGPLGTLASVVIVVAGTLLMLGLFALHIVLSSALVVMFVGGPLLIVLAPFPGTAWMSALAFRAFATLLAWPVIWAICFACFAAVFNDFVTFRGDGGVLDKTLVKPLTGVAMLYLCVRLPLLASKASMLGIGTAGTVGFAARYVAVRQAGQLSSRLAGGDERRRTTSSTPGREAASRSVVSRSAGAATAAAAPTTTAPGSSGPTKLPRDTAAAPSRQPDAAQQGRTDSSSRSPASMPASVRALGERPRQLEEEMLQARRRAGAPGQPAAATEADVHRALERVGRGSAEALGNTWDRAISAGQNREAAMGAVTRTAAIGTARAEADADRAPEIGSALRTIGAAPSHAFVGGLEAYRVEATGSGSSGRPAPSPMDSPAAPRPRAPERRPGEVS